MRLGSVSWCRRRAPDLGPTLRRDVAATAVRLLAEPFRLGLVFGPPQELGSVPLVPQSVTTLASFSPHPAAVKACVSVPALALAGYLLQNPAGRCRRLA